MVSLSVEVCQELPPLVWVGEVTASGARALVGPRVEVFDEGFLEGTWLGDWESFDPLSSEAVCATGLLKVGDRLACVVSTHPEEYVFEVRTDSSLLLSNSHVLLLTILGERFASDVEDPITALVRSHHRGFTPIALALEGGGSITVHSFGHLWLDSGGKITRSLPPTPPRPKCFNDVRSLLQDQLEGLLANAVDARRELPLEPLLALSAGYDSVGVGAIAAAVGVREMVGLIGDGEDPTEIAKCLGLRGPILRQESYKDIDSFPEARFAASFGGINPPLAIFEEEFRGRVVLTGFGGDEVWDSERWIYGGNRLPLDRVCSHLGQEFRLSSGFIQIALPWQLLGVGRDVHKVTMSAEMDPWRVDGGYDRPIARRLGEEAGVPRGAFGSLKARGGSEPTLGYSHTMAEASFADLEAFLREHPERYQLPRGLRRRLGLAQLSLGKALRRLPAPLDEAVAWTGRLPFGASGRMGVSSEIVDAMAWGIERVRTRYVAAAEMFRGGSASLQEIEPALAGQDDV